MKNNKPLAMLSPLCLALLSGHASAALEPFTLGASETVQHQTNLNHTESDQVSDWISTTEFSAALNQALGRDKLVASAAVDLNRYKRSHTLDSTGYQADAEFDWSTIGDLSGSLGGSSTRRQYIAGETAEPAPGQPSVLQNVKNLQTDNHAFAHIALGAESRWSIFGGGDVSQRHYSLDSFSVNEERQWSGNAGTRYETSPDLSFGLNGNFTHGEYPNAGVVSGNAIIQGASKFNSRTVSLTSTLQASGNSSLSGNVGYTTESNQALSTDRKFVSGGLSWNWTPPSHFTVKLDLRRSSDSDASAPLVDVSTGRANTLNANSINNAAHLEVTYALTAKVSLDASTDYTQRKYADLKQVAGPDVNGATRTARFWLTAHYQPTRLSDVSCGGGRETRHADASIADLTPAYTDNYLQCAASIRFD